MLSVHFIQWDGYTTYEQKIDGNVSFLMHLLYILESNPHPNLICTQFLAIS